MSTFKPFAAAVAAQFALMSKHELFVTDIDGQVVYDAYLAAFPAGTNPIFRERTEHDCSCCRNFIKNIGNVVAIIDGQVVTVWDTIATNIKVDLLYRGVSEALALLIKATPIKTIFRTSEKSYGAESNKEMKGSALVRTWNHFHGKIDNKHFTQDVGTQVGNFNAAKDVFTRGLKELTSAALNTVLELINDKLLYRGDEHKAALVNFTKLHRDYRTIPLEVNREIFIMINAMAPASRFRNTVIGSLVIDLSEGMDEERAVKSFEQKVAPTNYKRPTALVTESMKQAALATIAELGLEDSLVRRLASPADVTINNVLWADGAAKATMKGGIADIMGTIPTKAVVLKEDKAEDISIGDFLQNILPKAKSMEMFVRNRHMTNFMAITAPTTVNNVSAELFKWDNDFAWTYTGNISDSIKERVKAAGGATDAVMRVSLAWHNSDDLDLHVTEPQGHICNFQTRGSKSRINNGKLDVDMNSYGPKDDKNPVENIVWDTPSDGVYKVVVNNYTQRTKNNGGFTVEVENNGVIQQFSSEQSPGNSMNIHAINVTVEKRIVTKIDVVYKSMTGSMASQEKWGVATEAPVRINMVMFSPNYWDDNAVGNKHFMFILDGCKTDEPLRGILNEYLNSNLEAHRKVFEMLGDKTKCQPTDQQLAGLGFSNTKGDSVTVTVTGDKMRKAYNIIF